MARSRSTVFRRPNVVALPGFLASPYSEGAGPIASLRQPLDRLRLDLWQGDHDVPYGLAVEHRHDLDLMLKWSTTSAIRTRRNDGS
jgi:hypothetical protein